LARCGRVGRLCGFPRPSTATDQSVGIDAESEGLAETVGARRMVAAYDNSRCEEGPPFVVTCEMNSESKKSYRPLQVRSVMIIYIIKPLAEPHVRADTKLRVRLSG
jgi:hypothetical protein